MTDDLLERVTRTRAGVAVGGLLGGLAGVLASVPVDGWRSEIIAGLVVVGAIIGATVSYRRAGDG